MKTFRRQRVQPMPPDRVLRSSWRVGRTVTMIQHLEVIPGAPGEGGDAIRSSGFVPERTRESSNRVLTIDNEHALGAKNHIPDPTD
jgi:hypothetical protein